MPTFVAFGDIDNHAYGLKQNYLGPTADPIVFQPEDAKGEVRGMLVPPAGLDLSAFDRREGLRHSLDTQLRAFIAAQGGDPKAEFYLPAAVSAMIARNEATVEVLGDLWDLPERPRTAIYLPPRAGERDLKIDLVEQAYQLLPKDGQFVVWSSEAVDRLFPDLLKKVFKKVHSHATESGHVLWAVRGEDKPRRTRELTYRARVKQVPSQSYVSRPGVFGYGKFDNGARALAEIAAQAA